MTGSRDRGYDDALSSIRNGAEDLAVALLLWEARDDTRACPEARRAASDAVDAIDAMLAALHAIRARLIGEIRASDQAAESRADQLLARLRSADAATTPSRDQSFPGQAGPGKPEAGRFRGTPGPARQQRTNTDDQR